MYLCLQSAAAGAAAAAAAAAAALCVAMLLLVLQLLLLQLLLFMIVCRTAKFVAGSVNLIPVCSSSSLKTFIFTVPLGSIVAFTASICVRTSSVFTGMRGAMAGASPPRRRSPFANI